MQRAEDTVYALISAINAHDPEKIVALCTPQHRLIDSLGNVVSGREVLRSAWASYFALFPDYLIEVEALTMVGCVAHASGWASGSLRGRKEADGAAWKIPTAWRAAVNSGQVEEWQVYADNKPVYEVLQRAV